MKIFYLTCLFFTGFLQTITAQTTYKWNVSSGSWATATSWSPARSTPATNDILEFDGSMQASPIVTFTPTETVGKIRIYNNCSVIFGASASNRILTVGNTAIAAPHFAVEAGSTLALNAGTVTLTINIITGCTGQVGGTITFSGGGHRLTAMDANALVFQNGAVFTATTNFTGNAFGTASLNSIQFQAGAKYINQAGANPFGATQPNSVLTFLTGSLYSHQQALTPALNGRTYANFEIDDASFNQTNMTGGTVFRCDTLTIKNAISAGFNLTGGMVVSGNLTVQSGTVSFSPNNSGYLLFDGKVPQQVSGNINLNSNMHLMVAKDATVNLLTDITTPDSLSVFGTLMMNNQTISGGSFVMFPATVTVPGAMTGNLTNLSNQITNLTNVSVYYPGMGISGTGIPANTYILNVNPSANTLTMSRFATAGGTGIALTPSSAKGKLGIGSPNGITAAPAASGNVQFTSRAFQTEGDYEYTGTTAQVTGNGLPASVKNLILRKTGNDSLTLTSSVNVDDTLSLQRGLLLTNAARLPLLRDTTAITSTTSPYFTCCAITNTGYKNSFIHGPVSVQTNSTNTRWIPTGKVNTLTGDTLFAPAALQPVSAVAKTYTTEYFPQGHFDTNNVQWPPLDHVSKVEYWNISTADANPDAKVTLTWRPKSLVGNGNPADSATAMQDLVVAHYFDDGMTGIKWRIDGAGPTFTIPAGVTLSNGLITTNLNIGSFSPFTLGTKSPFNFLPVRLISFTANAEARQVRLDWLTEQEREMDQYIIERSTDGRNFAPVLSRSASNSTGQHRYTATDADLAPGGYYYRLKLAGNRNSSRYSNIIKVWLGGNGLVVSPSPAEKEIKILLPWSSNSEIALVNSTGQVVKRVMTSQNSLTIDVTSLSRGMYIITVRNSQQVLVQRFMKQ